MPACPTCGVNNVASAKFCNECGSHLGTPREPSGERRVVTMLFCDVRGSTSMAETLDAEEWTDIMNEAFEQLIPPVYRYEGTVARLMGDAILAFFGAPTAHEDDPQRAVMAGLEIVSAIGPLREKLRDERGLDLNVRVGINTGPVVVGDVGSELRQEYTAMGDAVNVAARMEQTAEPGTVQITEGTYRLIADLFEVESLGGVELKGKREPVLSYRVIGRHTSPWRVRAARSLSAPLVGRDAEMDVVRSALDDVERGRGSILLIIGEPGIGKSRLVAEANALWDERHPDDDHHGDVWQCLPSDSATPYAQYRRMILERADIRDADPAEVVREKITGFTTTAPEAWVERRERLVRALLGVELPGEPRLEGEAFQREAMDVVAGSTLAVGGRRLMVFEDLHWCDSASLTLARAIAELVAHAPIGILMTFRPDRSAPSWNFMERIRSDLGKHTHMLELGQLTDAESGQMLKELLPVEGMSEDARHRILARTEGNPLFVEEVARALLDAGAMEGSDGEGLPADLAIPSTIQSLITAGLDRLSESARRTLQAASVIGRTFDEQTLGAVAEANGELAADLLTLQERDLIRRVREAHAPEFTFRHALTHEAAYGSLLIKRRKSLHRRVAEVLESTNAGRLEDVAPLLERHFSEAGDDRATYRYAMIAARAARRLYANAEAEAHYRVAIDAGRRLGVASEDLLQMYAHRGNALELQGRYDDAVANYEEWRATARELGDESLELAAESAFAVLYATATPLFDPKVGLELSEQTLAKARRLGDRAAEARSLWNILLANVYGGGDAGEAIEAGEASVAISRELGDLGQLAFTLNDLSRAYLANGDRKTASARLDDAHALWIETDNRPMLCESLTISSQMRLLEGDLGEAMSLAGAAFSTATEIDNGWATANALIARYRTEWFRGDLGAAMRTMHLCMTIGDPSGFAFSGIGARMELAEILSYLGDGAAALPYADRAVELAEERAVVAVGVARVSRAQSFLALGDLERAGEALESLEMALPEPERTLGGSRAELTRSQLALASRDAMGAEEFASNVLKSLRTIEVRIFVADALVARARALLAQSRFSEADLDLADAIRCAKATGERRPLWEARALAARIRDQEGEPSEAEELRRRAQNIVNAIADGVDDEGLRGHFLARAATQIGSGD